MVDLRFVHAADLHLGSPFVGISSLDSAVGRAMQRASFEAFDALLAFCREQRADFLLIAGDVYDSEDRNLAAQLRFVRGLNKLAEDGIPSFVVHGNHDPLTQRVREFAFHRDVHVFGCEQVESFTFSRGTDERARIYGISYGKREVKTNLAKGFLKEDSAPFSIALLHANLGGQTGHDDYAPCSLDDLVSMHMDYVALGHVHTHQVIWPKGSVIVYPGNIQGRSVCETGPRGCCMVQVEGHRQSINVEIEFRALDVVRWGVIDVAIDNVFDVGELVEVLEKRCVAEQAQANGRPLIIRLKLVGRGPVHSDLFRPDSIVAVRNDLQERFHASEPFIWVESVVDESHGQWDREKISCGNDFNADLVRLVDSILVDPQAKSQALKTLDDLYCNRLINKAIEQPKDQNLIELIKKAEIRCLDCLLREEKSC
ncbi:MAG: DNA repair exonuclease [Pseudomonadota bacterium]